MKSKWIEDLEKTPAVMDMSPASWDTYILPVLIRIDNLLRRAVVNPISGTLLDSIEHEIWDWNKTLKSAETGRIVTGVSSVVPITDEEAERMFAEVDRRIAESGDKEEERLED